MNAKITGMLLVTALSQPLAAQEPSPGATSAQTAVSSAGGDSTSQADSSTAQRRRRGGPEGEAKLAIGGKEIRIAYPKLAASSADFATLEALAPGAVLAYNGSRAFKLFTAGDLVFGDRVAKAGNASPSYPGVYSLWLKRVEAGWALVFNHHADIWGSQHDASGDAVEVPLAHAPAPAAAEQLELVLEPAGENGGMLRITWGSHRWEAAFEVR